MKMHSIIHPLCILSTIQLLLHSTLPNNVVSAFSTITTTPTNTGSPSKSSSSSLLRQSTRAAEQQSRNDIAKNIINDNTNVSPLLQQLQTKHIPIASSFQPNKFNPHPYLNNRHIQTILGVFLRKNHECAYVSNGIVPVLGAISNMNSQYSSGSKIGDESNSNYWDRRERIATDCANDFFTADIKYATGTTGTAHTTAAAAAGQKTNNKKQMDEKVIKYTTTTSIPTNNIYQSTNSKGMVILIHGLESNSNSSLSTDMANAYSTEGYDVVCLNFRGCCGLPNDTLGGYHLGFTDDLKHFLGLMKEAWQSNDAKMEKRPIYLSGFSLGANVVVKCLGELGSESYTTFNIHGAAITGAPFDTERNIQCLDAPGFNRAIYSNNFLKTLKKRAQFQLDRHCDSDPFTSAFDFPRVMSATSIAEFDDAFIARIYGFENNIDFIIGRIRVITF